MSGPPWTFLTPPAHDGVEPAPRSEPPSFSVVIAAYNVAPYIGEAIRSALEQTVPPHEVVVCDDGSTDDLDAALAPFLDRIRLVRQPNGGEASAKNAAVRAATGEFVSVLDGDDLYAPHRIEALGALAQARPDLDLLATDADVLEGTTVLGGYHELGKPFEVADQRGTILDHNFILCPAVRRDALLAVGGFDESIRYATDWDCWLRMVHTGSLAGEVDDRLVVYRRRAGQLTADELRIRAGEVVLLEKQGGLSGLSAREADQLAASLSNARLLRARAAVLGRDPSARAAAWPVARDRRRGWSTRGRAALAALSPGVVATLERRWPSGLAQD